jgi:molybdopterin-guanine dinucleotide biosynthesis protein A
VASSAVDVAVTGVILSGGRGSRMGGVDKGLLAFRGRTMLEWVLDRIEPQVAEVLISANQNLSRYLAFGHPVLTDRITGFAGPLAGLHAGLCVARCDLVMMVPCDSPFLPLDLVQRMTESLERARADIAVARSGERRHSAFCLCRVSVLDRLTAFLDSGERKVEAWYASWANVAEVLFDDRADNFRNINTPEELRALER